VTHFGLAIHPDTNDLHLEADGNLAVVHGAKAVGQHVRQRLKTYSGEWFLDTTAGVPWLDEIMGGAYDPGVSEAVVKGEILETHGVVEITSFSVQFNLERRDLMIRDVAIITTYDEQEVRV
jgi:hypothetical protein